MAEKDDVEEQKKKAEIAKYLEEEKRRQEEEKKRKEQQEKEMEEKVRKILDEQLKEKQKQEQQQNQEKSTKKKDPNTTQGNPYEEIKEKRITKKRTLMNPHHDSGVYTSIDPEKGNFDFEFDESFDPSKKQKFYDYVEDAKKNNKAITVPDGVKAYKVEEKEEEIER